MKKWTLTIVSALLVIIAIILPINFNFGVGSGLSEGKGSGTSEKLSDITSVREFFSTNSENVTIKVTSKGYTGVSSSAVSTWGVAGVDLLSVYSTEKELYARYSRAVTPDYTFDYNGKSYDINLGEIIIEQYFDYDRGLSLVRTNIFDSKAFRDFFRPLDKNKKEDEEKEYDKFVKQFGKYKNWAENGINNIERLFYWGFSPFVALANAFCKFDDSAFNQSGTNYLLKQEYQSDFVEEYFKYIYALEEENSINRDVEENFIDTGVSVSLKDDVVTITVNNDFPKIEFRREVIDFGDAVYWLSGERKDNFLYTNVNFTEDVYQIGNINNTKIPDDVKDSINSYLENL